MNDKVSPLPLLVSNHKIWDLAGHNGFTDIHHIFDKYYIAFREAESHQDSDCGIIRLLESNDGAVWEPVCIIEEEGVDLRDPKLSTMPDGRLCLLMGGSKLEAKTGKLISTSTRVSFADKSLNFTPPRKVLPDNEWLWRITWHQGIGYGVSYEWSREFEWIIRLYKTEDALTYVKMNTFELEERPNEATIRFDHEGLMWILIRRSGSWKSHAVMGCASEPYDDWIWYDIGYSVGGPNFLILDEGEIWIAGRLMYASPYGIIAKTGLLCSEGRGFRRKLLLPSGGDSSYPGMIRHEDFLWISYYSSHEGSTAIYFAKVLLP